MANELLLNPTVDTKVMIADLLRRNSLTELLASCKARDKSADSDVKSIYSSLESLYVSLETIATQLPAKGIPSEILTSYALLCSSQLSLETLNGSGGNTGQSNINLPMLNLKPEDLQSGPRNLAARLNNFYKRVIEINESANGNRMDIGVLTGKFLRQVQAEAKKFVDASNGAYAELFKLPPIKILGYTCPGIKPAQMVEQMTSDQKWSWDYVGGSEDLKNVFLTFEKRVKRYDQQKQYAQPNDFMPKAMLLVGPPGTGKTFIVQTFCNLANLPYRIITGSDVKTGIFSVSSSNLQGVYNDAKKVIRSGAAKGYVIFMDEVESLAPKKITSGIGASDVDVNDTTNTLLHHIDGVKYDTPGIFTIMASNEEAAIAPPVRSRASRYRFFVGMPDHAKRIQVLQAVLRRKTNGVLTRAGPQLNYSQIADATADFSCRDLDYLCAEAICNVGDLAIERGRQPLLTNEIFSYVLKTYTPLDKVKYTESMR